MATWIVNITQKSLSDISYYPCGHGMDIEMDYARPRPLSKCS